MADSTRNTDDSVSSTIHSNYYNNRGISDWRFYSLTWEQCQSLILAVIVVGIIVIPQWLFSFVTVPPDYAEQEKNRRHQRLLRQTVLAEQKKTPYNHSNSTPTASSGSPNGISLSSSSHTTIDTDPTKEN